MLDTLTKESFDPLKGDAFSLAHDGGTTLSLSLVAVLGTGLRGHASREQFARQAALARIRFRSLFPARFVSPTNFREALRLELV